MLRKLDPMGRVVVPVELRERMGLLYGDRVQIGYDEESRRLVIAKAEPRCLACNAETLLIAVRDEYICVPCLRPAW